MSSQQPTSNFKTPNPNELKNTTAEDLIKDGTLDESVENTHSNQDKKPSEQKNTDLEGDSQIVTTHISAS